MKRYTIYGANKSWKVATLETAIKIVEIESKTTFRMSIFEDNKKIACYENGKKVF